MTSNLSQYRTLGAMEPTGAELAPVIDVTNANSGGMDADLKLQLARRLEDEYQEGAPSAAAALFSGLFIGSASTALMIWVASLLF